MAQTVVLKVKMTENENPVDVRRALGRMDGVESFDIDVKEQKVIVKGNVSAEAVRREVAKTRRETSFWGAQAN